MSNPPEPSAANIQKFTPKQVSDWREAFSLFDSDKNNSITASEIAKVFETLGQAVTEEQIADILAEFDVDRNGGIDFDEFLTMMAAKEKDCEQDDLQLQVKAAFRAFDADGNGKIDLQELVEAMANLGEEVTLEEAKEMMEEADTNGDGFIDEEEFATKIFNF